MSMIAEAGSRNRTGVLVLERQWAQIAGSGRRSTLIVDFVDGAKKVGSAGQPKRRQTLAAASRNSFENAAENDWKPAHLSNASLCRTAARVSREPKSGLDRTVANPKEQSCDFVAADHDDAFLACRL